VKGLNKVKKDGLIFLYLKEEGRRRLTTFPRIYTLFADFRKRLRFKSRLWRVIAIIEMKKCGDSFKIGDERRSGMLAYDYDERCAPTLWEIKHSRVCLIKAKIWRSFKDEWSDVVDAGIDVVDGDDGDKHYSQRLISHSTFTILAILSAFTISNINTFT